jgi:hypothetical protein
MASDNVKAAYAQRLNVTPADKRKALRRKSRMKVLEAHRTVPRDSRAPTVVDKADADLAAQQKELGNDQSNDAQAPPQPEQEASGSDAGVGSIAAHAAGQAASPQEEPAVSMSPDAEPSNE